MKRTHTNFNRRDVLKASAMGAFALALNQLTGCASHPDANSTHARKRVLFFTKSSGFQHSVITRPADNPTKLAYAEQILSDLGAKSGFQITCSKDGNMFSPENINQFDAFVFYTTGDLTQPSDKYAMKKGPDGKKNIPDPDKLLWTEPPMPPGGKDAFLNAIYNGKGFIGIHSAADTFHSQAYVKGKVNLFRDVDDKGHDQFDPYIEMLGGEFIIHGAQQKSLLKVIDPDFPTASAFMNARFDEEWYSLKNFAPDLHVILAQDCTGMTGPMYQRAPYPETWARMHGKGRVFYTSMGHREDVWQRTDYLNLLLTAMNWTTGKIDADIKPNLPQATPGANVSPS